MMRVNPYLYGALAVILLVGVVSAAQSAGFWSTDNKYTRTGEKVQADPTNVDTIKGWMTLGDISRTYRVPVEEILAAFNLPPDTPSTATLKSLAESKDGDFEVSALRSWLGRRLKTTK